MVHQHVNHKLAQNCSYANNSFYVNVSTCSRLVCTSVKVDFGCRACFTRVKVECTFTRGLSYIAFILFTRVK